MTLPRWLRQGYWVLVPLALLVLDCVLGCVALPPEPVLDETVFFPAALAFARAGVWPGADFLLHYAAPQTPLALYCAGRVLASCSSLRLLRVLDAALMAFGLWRIGRFAHARRRTPGSWSRSWR